MPLNIAHWAFYCSHFFLLYVAEHFLALRGEDICLDITFHVSTFEEPPAAVRFNFISSSSGSLSSYPPSLASSFTSIHHICVYLRLVDVLPQELLHSPSCSPSIITFFFLITLSPALSCFFSLLPGTFFFNHLKVKYNWMSSEPDFSLYTVISLKC